MLTPQQTQLNTAALEQGLQTLQQAIESRLANTFPTTPQPKSQKIQDLSQLKTNATLIQFIKQYNLTPEAQLTLLIALAPHINPTFFETHFSPNKFPAEGNYPQIGGWRGKNHRGLLPTGETVLFILGGDDLSKRLPLQNMFSVEHIFSREHILYLSSPEDGEPTMSGKLILTPDYIHYFTQGTFPLPHFSTRFPAQRITTAMEEPDLVLNPNTKEQVEDLKTWLIHQKTLQEDWGLQKKTKPGYRVLFHGPPGTGKTLTASLLGKQTNREVYKIDLSMVVSKYIGETEKNLANLFARAENKGWILFFDEADALFGKRTNIRDSHDKYANQEVSYLLQRIENYNGLVILATNFKSNIDNAFIRRFQSIIYFPLPNSQERLHLWEKSQPNTKKVKFSDSDLSSIAETYELSGAEIVNIIQHCSLKALQQNGKKGKAQTIKKEDILLAIKREFGKAGKII